MGPFGDPHQFVHENLIEVHDGVVFTGGSLDTFFGVSLFYLLPVLKQFQHFVTVRHWVVLLRLATVVDFAELFLVLAVGTMSKLKG